MSDAAVPSVTSLVAAIRDAEAGAAGLGKVIKGTVDSAASLYDLVKPAVAFEAAMADLRTVVDFSTPQAFAEMQRDILAMSQRVPVAAENLAALIAHASRAGIARAELLPFAESAAKMSVTFDVTAQSAGQLMSNWRSGMALSQGQAVLLADAVSRLSDKTGANAGDLAKVVAAAGPLVKTMGLAEAQIAALGAVSLAAGAGPEAAATAVRNLGLALTAGQEATERQRKALGQLGFSAETLAARMQTDAAGAITAVLEALQKAPAQDRGSLAGMLFGEGAAGAIAPLVTNLQAVKGGFAEVATESNYAGAVAAKYDARAQTTKTNVQLLHNRLEGLSVTVGSELLPTMNELLTTIGPVLTGFADWAAANPSIIQYTFGAVAALTALKLAATGAGHAWALLSGIVHAGAQGMGIAGASRLMAAARGSGVRLLNGASAGMSELAQIPGMVSAAARSAAGQLQAMGQFAYRAAIQARQGLALIGPAVLSIGASAGSAMRLLGVALAGAGIGALGVGLGVGLGVAAAAIYNKRDDWLPPVIDGVSKLWRWITSPAAPAENAESEEWPLSDLPLPGGPRATALAASLAGAVTIGAAAVPAAAEPVQFEPMLSPSPMVSSLVPPDGGTASPIAVAPLASVWEPRRTDGVTISNTFNVTITVNGEASAEDWDSRIRDVFQELVWEAEAAQRSLLSD